jgi:hypothetical protein
MEGDAGIFVDKSLTQARSRSISAQNNSVAKFGAASSGMA